jgi:hypothetical protein
VQARGFETGALGVRRRSGIGLTAKTSGTVAATWAANVSKPEPTTSTCRAPELIAAATRSAIQRLRNPNQRSCPLPVIRSASLANRWVDDRRIIATCQTGNAPLPSNTAWVVIPRFGGRTMLSRGSASRRTVNRAIFNAVRLGRPTNRMLGMIEAEVGGKGSARQDQLRRYRTAARRARCSVLPARQAVAARSGHYARRRQWPRRWR